MTLKRMHRIFIGRDTMMLIVRFERNKYMNVATVHGVTKTEHTCMPESAVSRPETASVPRGVYMPPDEVPGATGSLSMPSPTPGRWSVAYIWEV